MEYVEEELVKAHGHCAIHEEEILASDICGCFHCLRIFSPEDITDWIDDVINGKPGRTALCPSCSIDSVIGSESGYPIKDDFLRAMNARWFHE